MYDVCMYICMMCVCIYMYMYTIATDYSQTALHLNRNFKNILVQYFEVKNFCRNKEYRLLLLLLLLSLLLLTAIELSLGGISPYTSTDKTNKNKYT